MDQQTTNADPSAVSDHNFIPSELNPEVCRVLNTLDSLEPRLPKELILTILSLARRFVCFSVQRSAQITYRTNDFYVGEYMVAGLYLLTEPVRKEVKCIKFKMTSADQGWATFGGNGTYNNSHTWFEASILKPVPSGQKSTVLEVASMPNFSRPIEARDDLLEQGWDFRKKDDGEVVWKVHNNITARSELADYNVEWVKGEQTNLRVEASRGVGMGGGEGFLEKLEPGDRVVLWARAEQACWKNIVAGATTEIGYDV